MGTSFSEGRWPGEAVLTEANGSRSRETVTVANGQGKLEAGTVVGKITTGGKYAASAPTAQSGTAGAETATAVTLYPVDATSADAKCLVIFRDAEVNGACLEYHEDVTTDAHRTTKATQLAAQGIIVR